MEQPEEATDWLILRILASTRVDNWKPPKWPCTPTAGGVGRRQETEDQGGESSGQHLTDSVLEQVSHSTAMAVAGGGLGAVAGAGDWWDMFLHSSRTGPAATEALPKQVKLVQVFTREQGSWRTHWGGGE